MTLMLLPLLTASPVLGDPATQPLTPSALRALHQERQDFARTLRAGLDTMEALPSLDPEGVRYLLEEADRQIPDSLANRSLHRAAMAWLASPNTANCAAMLADWSNVAADLAFTPRIESPTPLGFPAPSPVGEVVLLSYPSYRMASAPMSSNRNGGFWTLFRHIESHEIAMTAPVQMDMPANGGPRTAAMQMSFLYSDQGIGELGRDGAVEVRDVPEAWVLSTGFRGDLSSADRRRAETLLRAVLRSLPELEVAGPLRVMGWNSPFVPRSQRFQEVQLPVQLRTTPDPANGADHHLKMNSVLLSLPLLLTGASVEAPAPTAADKDIVSTAVAAGQFETLVAALAAGELVPALQGDGPFTVFAPSDAAFAKLPKGTVETLLKPENKGLLQAILKYHVVPGEYRAADVVSSPWLASMQSQRLTIATDAHGVRVAGARVLKADIACSNGVIHVIDEVMMPTTEDLVALAAGQGSFNTLAAAIEAAGLVEALRSEGPFTVFAPTDEAFAALPKGTLEELLKKENRDKLAAILKLHVVPGRIMLGTALGAGSATTLHGSKLAIRYNAGTAMVGKARILTADVEASNGVIHVIDRVLLP